MIDLSSVVRRASDVRFRAVDDETVVIRQEAAEALVLNEVAGRVLELADGRHTAGQIVDILQGEYEVEPDALERDVVAYLAELVGDGLLEVG